MSVTQTKVWCSSDLAAPLTLNIDDLQFDSFKDTVLSAVSVDSSNANYNPIVVDLTKPAIGLIATVNSVSNSPSESPTIVIELSEMVIPRYVRFNVDFSITYRDSAENSLSYTPTGTAYLKCGLKIGSCYYLLDFATLTKGRTYSTYHVSGSGVWDLGNSKSSSNFVTSAILPTTIYTRVSLIEGDFQVTTTVNIG